MCVFVRTRIALFHLMTSAITTLTDCARVQVPSIFPIMKKAYNFASTQLPVSMAQSVLAFLQFFLNHSDAVAYDPEPVFRFYFQTFLARHCMHIYDICDVCSFPSRCACLCVSQ